jgi:D-arabinose 1-dehydrogenase-like Zn-dependent alcohol dehydrogenase
MQMLAARLHEYGKPLVIDEVRKPTPGAAGIVVRVEGAGFCHSDLHVISGEIPALGCSGPLWVRGGITVESGDGTRYETRNRVTLCRCGASSNKPFCDGSHAALAFDDGLIDK